MEMKIPFAFLFRSGYFNTRMGYFVELDRSTIERLIEEKEQRASQLDGELTSLTNEIIALKKAISNQPELPAVSEISPSGRNKRGQSARIIEEYLKVSGLAPITLKDLSKSTKTSYATAIRIVNNLRDQGKVKSENGNWSWVR